MNRGRVGGRTGREARAESLWLLALSCVCAMSLALCGRSPLARAELAAGAAPFASSADADHALAPESDRPPGATFGDGGPSAAIFPPQTSTLLFDHARHVKQLALKCVFCHERAQTSRDASESLLPKAPRCDTCHGTDHRDLTLVKADSAAPLARCALCHAGYQPSDGNRVRQMSIPRPNLRFDHALHAMRNIGCPQCHGAVENLKLATRDQLPRMRGCLNCHQAPAPAAGRARSDCPTCHLTEPSGMLEVRFNERVLSPPSWLHDAEHGPDWIERHKLIAGNDSRFCGNCHSEKYCADCHDGRVRPRQIHPNDWLDMHAVAAQTAQSRCTSCHREQSFCLTCHQRAGVTESGPFGNASGQGRFHPPKAVWSEGPRTPRHHAWEAERNISACVSCHVERDCAICHATAAAGGRGTGVLTGASGRGVDPHPLGFQSRCAWALRQNARPCLVCHLVTDPNLQSCR